MAEEPRPRDDELLEELRALRVPDLLVQTLTLLASLAYGKLEQRELDEARLAIDAIRALLPAVRDALPPELGAELDRVAASLQLAYADAAS